MQPVHPPTPAPAKRLVLAVADGLRADKLFEDAMARAPYLKEKVFREGRWGLCHTRVPTESRPGHVALIAGFYEDVSAVTTGWTTNPVNFDSVFNQSRHTWSFGSPDILPMFSLGASDPAKVETIMYEAESEDFASHGMSPGRLTADSSHLDTWVFEHVEQLFANARTNTTLSALLHQDQIVFFLHLLGLDTNGHSHRPYSRQYLENIGIVDQGIKQLEALLNKFYKNDGQTAFIFASDHGMSNRGSHGDGDPQNTETPLIAWGAGINRPDSQNPTGHDDQSVSWKLEGLQRNDVSQADVAPLMSSLIGVPYPMNSVGKLPLPYLDNSEEYKAVALFRNALSIHAQYRIKAEYKERTELVFQPFKPLLGVDADLAEIETLIANKQYGEAESRSGRLISLLIDGLRYYQTYDWLLLRSIVSSGYLGWIVYSTLFIIKTYSFGDAKQEKDANEEQIAIGGLLLFAALAALLYVKRSPLSYYFYLAFPILFWSQAAMEWHLVPAVVRSLSSGSNRSALLHVLLYLGSLEVLVLSYFYRELLTVCLLLMGFLWPLTLPAQFCKRHYLMLRIWRALCLVTSVFTLLPVELTENLWLIVGGGLLIVASALLAVVLVPRYIRAALPTNASPDAPVDLGMVWTQIGIIIMSLVVLCHTS
ncbi:Glycosyl phosphatidyl inositol anchor synthesis, partial [Kappamyces sp. JEL0680]